MNWMPECLSYSLEYNPHKRYYEPVTSACPLDFFISEEELDKCIKLDTVYVLHIYVHTPIGFNAYAASTLEAIMEKVKQEKEPASGAGSHP
jgi:hypothetical protein